MNDEASFHAARIMWYHDGETLLEAPRGDTRSHKEWIGESWSSVVRGFYLNGALMIYQGEDFAEPDCDQGVLDAIMDHFEVRQCGLGCVPCVVGEVWAAKRIAQRSEDGR